MSEIMEKVRTINLPRESDLNNHSSDGQSYIYYGVGSAHVAGRQGCCENVRVTSTDVFFLLSKKRMKSLGITKEIFERWSKLWNDFGLAHEVIDKTPHKYIRHLNMPEYTLLKEGWENDYFKYSPKTMEVGDRVVFCSKNENDYNIYTKMRNHGVEFASYFDSKYNKGYASYNNRFLTIKKGVEISEDSIKDIISKYNFVGSIPNAYVVDMDIQFKEESSDYFMVKYPKSKYPKKPNAARLAIHTAMRYCMWNDNTADTVIKTLEYLDKGYPFLEALYLAHLHHKNYTTNRLIPVVRLTTLNPEKENVLNKLMTTCSIMNSFKGYQFSFEKSVHYMNEQLKANPEEYLKYIKTVKYKPAYPLKLTIGDTIYKRSFVGDKFFKQ